MATDVKRLTTEAIVSLVAGYRIGLLYLLSQTKVARNKIVIVLGTAYCFGFFLHPK